MLNSILKFTLHIGHRLIMMSLLFTGMVCTAMHPVLINQAHAEAQIWDGDKPEQTLQVQSGTDGTPIYVDVGKGLSISIPGSVSSVLVADNAIANIESKKPGQFFLYGRSVGSTSVTAIDENGVVILDRVIIVQHDLENVRRTLSERFPHLDINVSSSDGTVLLTGTVPDQRTSQDIEASVFPFTEGGAVINRLTVKTADIVRLYVKLVQIDDQRARNLGLNWRSLLSVGNIVLTQATSRDDGRETSDGVQRVDKIIKLLEQKDILTVISEPSLAAVSGESAVLRSGGNFPVPKGAQDDGSAGVEFQFFGVSLEFTPEVKSQDSIRLQINAEVSELQQANGIVNGNSLPFMKERSFNTTIDLASGHSFVTAGLFQSQAATSDTRPREIRRAPIIGSIGGNKISTVQQTELIAIVTPYLAGDDPADKPKKSASFIDPKDKQHLPVLDSILRRSGKWSPEHGSLPLLKGSQGFKF